MLHFAYGANMHRAVMRRHAPGAKPIGAATLAHYSFAITSDGYATVRPARAQTVHGVLWRITPRDRISLDIWESIASGRYRAATMAVRCAGRRRMTLVYIARRRDVGRPKPGYMELVIAAASEWRLSAAYISSLRDWRPRRANCDGAREFGEFGWT